MHYLSCRDMIRRDVGVLKDWRIRNGGLMSKLAIGPRVTVITGSSYLVRFVFVAAALVVGCDSLASQDPDVGCPGATCPDWTTSPYVLPFPVGKEYRVDLSNCSGSFHGEGQPDEFATDFAMPVGTPITAA